MVWLIKLGESDRVEWLEAVVQLVQDENDRVEWLGEVEELMQGENDQAV